MTNVKANENNNNINENLGEKVKNGACTSQKRKSEGQEKRDDGKKKKIDKELFFFYPGRYIFVDGEEVLIRDPDYDLLKQFNEMNDWYCKIKSEENMKKRETLLREYLDFLWTFEGNRKQCEFVKPKRITTRLNEKDRLLFSFCFK
ncbi:hypothetical protein BD408DRAFT_426526 [Parasitella parasitica]|nr:hypothetical protein BD408DRAFT_426526 [Parasitella parasitica]